MSRRGVKIEWEKVARRLCLRKRETAICSKDQVASRKLKKFIFLCILKSKPWQATRSWCRSCWKTGTHGHGSILLALMIAKPLGNFPQLRTRIGDWEWLLDFFRNQEIRPVQDTDGLRRRGAFKLGYGWTLYGQDIFFRGLYQLISKADNPV